MTSASWAERLAASDRGVRFGKAARTEAFRLAATLAAAARFAEADALAVAEAVAVAVALAARDKLVLTIPKAASN